MRDVSFNGLAVVAAVGLGAPLVLGLFPKIRLPAIVLEILLGVAIGPQVLGRVSRSGWQRRRLQRVLSPT